MNKNLTYNSYIFCFLIAMLSCAGLKAQEVGGGNSTTTKTEVKVEKIIKPANERAADISNNMITELHLNSHQADQVRKLTLEAARRMDAIRAKYKGQPDKILEEGRKVDMDMDQKLSDILTPSQWSQYMRGKGRS